MSRKWVFWVGASLGTVCVLGWQAAPALASSPAVARSALVGVLGYEGGPAPGGFHPSSGSVDVQFTNQPLVLNQRVGPTGHFRTPLGPGKYVVIGCGPSSSGGQPLCSQPKNVTLKTGEVDHIRLVWAFVP
jgi:hypothetical protein